MKPIKTALILGATVSGLLAVAPAFATSKNCGNAPQSQWMGMDTLKSKAEGMERGLGLGLYIVRTFVEAHGGEVWIEDEKGMGTVIAFSLPLDGGSV